MMRTGSLLANEAPAQVASIAEFYAIAFEQADTAAQRYGALASGDESFDSVRSVFAQLEHRELHRAQTIRAACVAALKRSPDPSDKRWMPADLIAADELSEFANSSLSTPYAAWALAVRHRERGFAFWTYVAALAQDNAVRAAAENMAREALHDANAWRRERRMAWRSERHLPDGLTSQERDSDIPLAALLESLLQKDILEWSQDLPVVARSHLLAATGNDSRAPVQDRMPASGTLEKIKRRAIRRAEQLSAIYLDEADRAEDQAQLELAQKLAARAITRLADLRTMAAAPGP